MTSYSCPVCGFAGLYAPPYDEMGCASFDICPCCGTEFGYDDSKTSHSELRRRWIGAGALWSNRTVNAPPAWDAIRQMRSAGLHD